MADLTKTVKVLFQGDDEISPTIKGIAANVDKFSAGVEGIADPFAKIADGVLALDAALVTLTAVGLALAFKASSDFEASSTSLSKILGDEVDQIKVVEAAVISLSNQYGQAATSVLDSTTDFKRAGFAVADSLLLTEKGIGLVIGAAEAELDVARSTEIIIASLKGFNAPASEAGRLTDILNSVSNEYATSVVELGTGLSKLAPIARLSNLSFEETAAVLTPVIEVFRSGDEAAIALKKGLLALVSDQAPVRAALESIGVAQKDANGALRSGKDIIFDVAEAFKTTEENQKLFLASELVGIQQAGRLVTVFDSLAKVTEITGVAMAATGSIQKEVNAVLDTSRISVNRFITSFVNLGVKVGDEFRDAAKGAIDGSTDIEIALQSIVGGDTFQPVFDAINEFSGDLGDLLSQIARDLPEAFENVDFSGLISAIGGISEELEGLFDGIDLSTPEGLGEAIQTVVNTLTTLANVTAGIVQSFGPTVDFVVELISSFNDLDAAAQKRFGNLLGAAKIITDFGFKTAAAIILIGDAAAAIAPAFDIVVRLISGSFQAVIVIFDWLKLATIQIADEILGVLEKFSFGQFGADVSATRALFSEWEQEVQKSIVQGAADAEKSLTGLNIVFGSLAIDAKKSAKGVLEVGDAALKLFDIPDRKEIVVSASLDADFAGISAEIDAIQSEKTVAITATVDTSQATEELEFFDEAGNRFTITVPVETKGLKDVKDDIESIPTEKILEIKIQGDIDREIALIAASADVLQTSIEFEAKLGIARAEGDAQVLTQAFDSAGASVVALADSTEGMFGSLLGGFNDLGSVDQNIFRRQVEKQQDAQNEALESQIKLTDAQTKAVEAKTEAIERGDAIITFNVSPELEPAFDLVLRSMLKYTQARVTEEGADMLLGL